MGERAGMAWPIPITGSTKPGAKLLTPDDVAAVDGPNGEIALYRVGGQVWRSHR